MAEPEGLGDDEWIAQRISRNRPDIDSPRPQDADGVSGFRGRISPEEARRRVVKGGSPGPNDGVRYAPVGALRAAGFEVNATPNNRNRLHVSIVCLGDWDQAAAAAFVSCFSEILWFEGEEES